MMALRRTNDLFVTLVLWVYFILGFLILYFPRYLIGFLPREKRELRYQRLHHLFFRRFFSLVRFLIPSLSFKIDPGVNGIQSAVIVCNHLSYLDPLLLISQYEWQKTIAKSTFFRVPVFGWLIKQSGYVPAAGKGVSAWHVAEHILGLGVYLKTGGNVFVFPEGTRSRTGKIADLAGGAFEIAKRSNAPVKVLFVENTDMLFKPGTFLFNTAIRQPIQLRLIASLDPDYSDPDFSVDTMMGEVKALFETETSRAQEKTKQRIANQ